MFLSRDSAARVVACARADGGLRLPERRHLWSSRPSIWLLLSSVADPLIASTLAVAGIAMAPLPAPVVAGTLAAAFAFAVLLDLVKVPVFRRLKIT